MLPDILAALGAAESRARDPRAVEHLEQALELTRAPERRAAIALDLGRALMMDGRVADEIKTLLDASAELGKSDAEPKLRLEAELLAAAGASVRTRPVIAGRLESLRERVQGRRPDERVLLANLAFEQVFHGGHAVYAAELATRALADGALLTERRSESVTYYTAVWTLALCDQLTAAAAALDAAIADARAHGSALGFAAASGFRAVVNYRSGMLLDAEADARAALAVNMDLRGGFGRPFVTGVLAEALIDRGELEQAAEALAHVDAANSDSITVKSMLFSRGRLRLRRGDAEASLSDLLDIGRRSAGWGRTVAIRPWLSTAALALARLDRHDEAVALVEQELAMARPFGAPRALAIALCGSGWADSKRSSALLRPVPCWRAHRRCLSAPACWSNTKPRYAASTSATTPGHSLRKDCGSLNSAPRSRSPSAPATSSRPPACGVPAETTIARRSPRASGASRKWPPAAFPTARSRKRCSSPRKPSNGT
jgi:tetratricopeptide (TPR) repeat protein